MAGYVVTLSNILLCWYGSFDVQFSIYYELRGAKLLLVT